MELPSLVQQLFKFKHFQLNNFNNPKNATSLECNLHLSKGNIKKKGSSDDTYYSYSNIDKEVSLAKKANYESKCFIVLDIIPSFNMPCDSTLSKFKNSLMCPTPNPNCLLSNAQLSLKKWQIAITTMLCLGLIKMLNCLYLYHVHNASLSQRIAN